MPDTAVTPFEAVAEGIAGSLRAIQEEIPDLQVEPFLLVNPTPPTLDVYPADPAVEDLGFGDTDAQLNFTVRARVTTGDHEAGWRNLYRLMAPFGPTSVRGALQQIETEDVELDSFRVDGPSGAVVFDDPGGQNLYLGCTWTVVCFVTETVEEPDGP